MYQSIRHTHYQQNNSTRSLADFLNLLRQNSDGHGVQVVAVVLIKKDWTPKHYEILEWEVLIWCAHVFTDDELAPMLYTDVEED